MIGETAAALLAIHFTAYPVLGDRGLANPPAAGSEPRIEATTDRGPIVELIVHCPVGTAIISYSKLEHVYCTPRMSCTGSLKETISKSCR